MSVLIALGCAVCAVVLLVPAYPGQRLAQVSAGRASPNTGHHAYRMSELVFRRIALRRGRSRRRQDAIDGLQAFAGELRAGQPMRRALPQSLSGHTPRACAAAVWGGDVAEALRRDAHESGVALWRQVAACWEVSEASGAGLAVAIDRLVVTSRAAEEVRVALESHLAAPRATARMLSLLPVMGVLLGLALGGDPLGWLLFTPVGQLCLLGGLLLTGLGLWWVRRIATKVEVRL
ncbi:MAG: type II secretion system F family protein [Actinomycetes bacterium]